MPARILIVPPSFSTNRSYEEALAHASMYQQQHFAFRNYAFDDEWNLYAGRYGYNAGYFNPNCDTNPARTTYSRNYESPAKTVCSYSRKRKRPFTIEAILELDDDIPDRKKNNNQDLMNQNSWTQQRLSPEAVFVPSTNFDDNPALRYEAVSPAPSSSAPNELTNATLPSLGPESESLSNSCKSPEKPSSPRKAKRIRTLFTPNQLQRLETEFEKTQYLVGTSRLQLAGELSLTDAQVKVWFQNRRIKERKQFRKVQQAKIAKIKDNTLDNNQSELNNGEVYSSCTSGDESSNEQLSTTL